MNMSIKIKLAILERDISYLKKVSDWLRNEYTDKLEVYSFTDEAVALENLEESKIEVLLADDSFHIDAKTLPQRCSLAYLVESMGVDTVNNQTAIFKYQKVEQIYKQIIDVYADNPIRKGWIRPPIGNMCRITAFASAAGGVGSSSLAAACAINFAKRGKRTLYLNLEQLDASSVFFSGEGQFGMSKVVLSIKSKKANLALKLESYVRKDQSGVFFFAPADIAMDIIALRTEEILSLLYELQTMGAYDVIVLDSDFSLDDNTLNVFRKAHSIVLVSDGSEIANLKTERAFQAIEAIEQNADAPITNRIKLMYNRFNNKTSKMLSIEGLETIGGAPRLDRSTAVEMVRELSKLEVFENVQ